MEPIDEPRLSPMTVYLHYVRTHQSEGPEWKPVYFAEKAKADTLPRESECRHDEPFMVSALHDATQGKFFRLSTREEIEVH